MAPLIHERTVLLIQDDTPGNLGVREDHELVAALREAVSDQTLSLCYQPIVRSGDGDILGFEALLRWTHPTQGEISPGVFVPMAQESGLMPVIGPWVAGSAAAQVVFWQRQGLTIDANLHVNFSLAELLDPQLPANVAAAISTAGLPAEQFCFEVTERDLAAGGVDAARAVEQLATYGFKPVLDDFGPQSTIETLTRHAFAYAKIDRSLLIQSSAPPHWRRLLRGLRGLCRTLNITLVAEGIEGKNEMGRVAALGFGHAQGFAFGRPETAAAMGRALSGERSWGSGAL